MVAAYPAAARIFRDLDADADGRLNEHEFLRGFRLLRFAARHIDSSIFASLPSRTSRSRPLLTCGYLSYHLARVRLPEPYFAMVNGPLGICVTSNVAVHPQPDSHVPRRGPRRRRLHRPE